MERKRDKEIGRLLGIAVYNAPSFSVKRCYSVNTVGSEIIKVYEWPKLGENGRSLYVVQPGTEAELETWTTSQKIRKVIEKQKGCFNVTCIVLECGHYVEDMDFKVQVEKVLYSMVTEGIVNHM